MRNKGEEKDANTAEGKITEKICNTVIKRVGENN